MAQNRPPFNEQPPTSPTITVRPKDELPAWRRMVGWASLLGAIILTVGAIILLVLPSPEDPMPPTDVAVMNTDVPSTDAPTDIPTTAPVINAENPTELPPTDEPLIPTINPEQIAELLATPLDIPDTVGVAGEFDPFTIIPERPRNEFIDYTVARGDTIDVIARRYNLAAESIAWCNDRRIIFVLRPGDILRVPPVDGACHPVLGTREQTIAEIALDYNIDDPFLVIDSPYNPQLFGRSPEDVLPGGTTLFLPGGEGELITWNPGSDVTRNADGSIQSVSFAPGQSGSCGAVAPSGGAAWGNPLPNGTWIRGFYPGHTGIDLAAPTGTPIFASNSGPVLFSGFSQWGYGQTIVLAHGPFSTLYAHMSQRNLSCGQFATVGQVIGLVGSTGNSSGPHLHFEIRVNDTPQNPSLTPGIGW